LKQVIAEYAPKVIPKKNLYITIPYVQFASLSSLTIGLQLLKPITFLALSVEKQKLLKEEAARMENRNSVTDAASLIEKLYKSKKKRKLGHIIWQRCLLAT
jgi:hypothetical protein